MRSLLGSIFNKTPVSFSPHGSTAIPFMMGGRTDAEAQMRTMGSNGTVFSIVNRLSTSVAGTDWDLFRSRDGRGRISGEEERREVFVHPALTVINKPNPFMTRQSFFEISDQHLELTGETFWVVAKLPNMDMPLELWPVRPDRMQVVPHPTEFIAGFIYKGPNGEQVPLEVEDVIFIKMPNPLDPYRGMGPVQSVLTHIDSARFSAEWNRNFFFNSAEPGGIIKPDKVLSDPEFKQMISRWREGHQGVHQAHRVAVLENADFIERKFTQKDMQFSELLRVNGEILREAFGMSKTMLGLTEDVNRATAEAAEYIFSKYTLTNRLDRFKSALNHSFLPLFSTSGQGVEFDYDDPTPENKEAKNAERQSKVTAFKTLIDAGVDPGDAAEVVGLPDMKMAPKPTPQPSPNPNFEPQPGSSNGAENKHVVRS